MSNAVLISSVSVVAFAVGIDVGLLWTSRNTHGQHAHYDEALSVAAVIERARERVSLPQVRTLCEDVSTGRHAKRDVAGATTETIPNIVVVITNSADGDDTSRYSGYAESNPSRYDPDFAHPRPPRHCLINSQLVGVS